jgi:hypothetical protein
MRLATGLLEPVEHLGGRVDLVVAFALWERDQLKEVFGERCGLFAETHKTVLDHRGLRMILSEWADSG